MMTSPGRSTRLAIWLLRPVLLLYPSRFRRTYTAEMLEVFAARITTVQRDSGALAALRVWAHTAFDLLTCVGAEWVRTTHSPIHPVRSTYRDRQKRGDSIMSAILQDARLAIRTLAKQPSFALVAVATLALGIGANTAIFSLVNTVLLEPLPFPNSHELVRIWSSNPAQDRERYFTSPLSYYEWQDRTEALTAIAAAWPRDVTLTDDLDTPVQLRTMSTTVNWFEVLGVQPLLGRTLGPDDALLAWQNWVLVLSHGIWQDRFGSDPTVIGRAIRIDGQPAEIIGVLPPGAGFPETVDLWTNFVPPRTQSAQYMDVIGRVRPGATPNTALADLQAIARGLEAEFPRRLSGWSVDVAPLYEVVVGDVRPALLMLIGATGLVLAIACANVANLLLARTEKRYREMALRSALGAGRWRLVRQLLTESVVMGGVGAVAGVVVALVGLRALMSISPASLPRFDGVHLDLPMLGVALASAIVTGLAFGLAPALQLLRVDLHAELKEGGQRAGGGRRGAVVRDVFVVTQMALAVIVTVGAGLLIRSFANLRDTDPGFDSAGVLTFELNLPPTSYPTWTNVSDAYDGLLEQIRALPTVERAGITSSLPLSEPLDYLLQVIVVGEPPPEQGTEPHAWYRQISPELLESTGVPLIRGRTFEASDREDAPAVVIVNRTLARTLFGDGNPIGRQLSGVSGAFGPLGQVFNNRTEIIGVVDDVRYGSLREPAAPSMYFPSRQAPFRRMTFVVRTSGDPTAIVPIVRREVAATDPNLAVNDVSTLSSVVERSIARDRFAMMLVTLFGVLAVTLAAVGIYGVLSYTVAQRTRELGVRIALGASGPAVLRHVMRQMIVVIALGVGVGTLGALAATQAISSQLFGVTGRDPVTFGVVALLLGGVACFACYLPALRATKISPLTALRYD